MQEWVYFQIRQTGNPNQRWQIVDGDVTNFGAGRFAPRYTNGFDPRWREGGSIFFIEEIAEHSIGKTLESYRAVS